MGAGPGTEGSSFDLALTELLSHIDQQTGHRFLVDIGSRRGADLLGRVPSEAADEATVRQARAGVEAAADQMGRQMERRRPAGADGRQSQRGTLGRRGLTVPGLRKLQRPAVGEEQVPAVAHPQAGHRARQRPGRPACRRDGAAMGGQRLCADIRRRDAGLRHGRGRVRPQAGHAHGGGRLLRRVGPVRAGPQRRGADCRACGDGPRGCGERAWHLVHAAACLHRRAHP